MLKVTDLGFYKKYWDFVFIQVSEKVTNTSEMSTTTDRCGFNRGCGFKGFCFEFIAKVNMPLSPTAIQEDIVM